jgi:DNA-binding response OmpR family regulator
VTHPRPSGSWRFDIPRILCAADEEDLLALVALRLESAGFRVTRARNGEQALVLARELRPDVVVLDAAMPRRTGTEVLEALRADPATSDLRVILLAAGAQTDDVERGMGVGADAYLAKPFRATELVGLVRRLLEPPAPLAA